LTPVIKVSTHTQETFHTPSTPDTQTEETSDAPSSFATQTQETTNVLATSTTLPHRKRAREGMVQQAERMLKRSRIDHVAGNLGNNITMPISLVDRGLGDPRNIMGVIIDRDNNDLYRIAVRGGVLAGKYARNQFDLCTQKLLTREDVSEVTEVGLRRPVQLESRCGGQGFVKCNCTGAKRCATNRCKCFKARVKCNSRCHTALACENKH